MALTNLDSILSNAAIKPQWRDVSYTGTTENRNVDSLPYYEQFPHMATSHRLGPAQWVDNRDNYVRQYTGSAYIAIGAIARMAAMQKAKVLRRVRKKSGTRYEEVKPTHPLVELFEEVNPIDTPWDLWFYTIGWELIAGNAYIYKARNGFGTPKQLWPMPPQWVQAIPDPVSYISGYEINSKFGFKFKVPKENIIDVKAPSLDWSDNGRYYGQPAIKAAAVTLDLENEMLKRLYYQFQNFAPPSMVFETDQRLQPHQVQQLWAQFAAQHAMSSNSGKPMIVHSGMKLSGSWNSNSDKELSYVDSLDKTLELTLATLGVPKAVVGLVKDGNRSNTEAAITSFAYLTLNPLLEQVSQHLTQNLARDFAPDRSLIVQIGPCEVNKLEGLRQSIETMIRAGAITPNEVRHMLAEMPPLDSEHGDNPVMISGFQQTGQEDQESAGQSPKGQVSQVSRMARSGQNQHDTAELPS